MKPPETQLADLVVHAMTGQWPEEFHDEDRAAWLKNANDAIRVITAYMRDNSSLGENK